MSKAIIWAMAFIAIFVTAGVVSYGVMKFYRALMRETELDEAAELRLAKERLREENDKADRILRDIEKHRNAAGGFE